MHVAVCVIGGTSTQSMIERCAITQALSHSVSCSFPKSHQCGNGGPAHKWVVGARQNVKQLPCPLLRCDVWKNSHMTNPWQHQQLCCLTIQDCKVECFICNRLFVVVCEHSARACAQIPATALPVKWVNTERTGVQLFKKHLNFASPAWILQEAILFAFLDVYRSLSWWLVHFSTLFSHCRNNCNVTVIYPSGRAFAVGGVQWRPKSWLWRPFSPVNRRGIWSTHSNVAVEPCALSTNVERIAHLLHIDTIGRRGPSVLPHMRTSWGVLIPTWTQCALRKKLKWARVLLCCDDS